MLKFFKTLPLKYFDIVKPSLFQAIKYYSELDAIKVIEKYDLLSALPIEEINAKKIKPFDDNLLMYCVVNSKPKLVELLLESKKFDLAYENNKGHNFIFYVAKYNLKSPKIIELFIEKNVHINEKNLNDTVRELILNASISLEPSITKFLIKYNVKPTHNIVYKDIDGTLLDLFNFAQKNANESALKAILNTNLVPRKRLEEEVSKEDYPKSIKKILENKLIEMEKDSLDIFLVAKNTVNPRKRKI